MPRRIPVKPAGTPVATLRVAKTLLAGRPGTRRWVLQHGANLVCVRHRIDPRSNMRHVTVELVAETLPIQSRDNTEVCVRLPPGDKATRQALLAFGAQWHPQTRVWRMPRSVARTLRLLKLVVVVAPEDVA